MSGVKPLVAIVIPVWNGWEDTKRCLDSLSHVAYPNAGIILVDNGSTDATMENLINHSIEGRLAYIGLDSNRGFAVAANIGIKEAKRWGAEYVMLLNNDTVVHPLFLDMMLPMKDGYGMGQPDVQRLDLTGTDTTGHIISWGRVIDRKNYRGSIIGASGCACLLRMEMIDQIGLFDERYISTSEDSEYSWRAHNAGWKAWFYPNSFIWHKRGTTVKRYTDEDPTRFERIYKCEAHPCIKHGTTLQKVQFCISCLYLAGKSEIGKLLGRNQVGGKYYLMSLKEMYQSLTHKHL